MKSKRLRAYLDSKVFIFGMERRESNSRMILDLVEEGKVTSVISYLTLEELREYFSRRYGRETAIDEVYYIVSLPNLEIVTRDEVGRKLDKYRGATPERDLPHLAAAVANVDYLVTYNRHFRESKAREFMKVIARGELVRLLGIEPKETGC